MLPLTSFRPFASTIYHILLCFTNLNFSIKKKIDCSYDNAVSNSISSHQINHNELSTEKIRRFSLSNNSLESNNENVFVPLFSRQKISSTLKNHFSSLTNNENSILDKPDLSKNSFINSEISSNYLTINAKKLEPLGVKTDEIQGVIKQGIKNMLSDTDNEHQLNHQQQKSLLNEGFFITIGDDYRLNF